MPHDPTAQPEYTFDPANANAGTPRGEGMVGHSLGKLGTGRSVVSSADNVILAGNKTYQQAIELGIPVQEIESDGTTLFVIKRMDLPYHDPRAKELAFVDNRSSEVGLSWDAENVQAIIDAGTDLGDWVFEDELDAILRASRDEDFGDLEQSANDYAKNTPSPVYEPTGDNPEIHDLTDTERRDTLVADIQTATVPGGIREFLVMAAQRHIVFDYRRIAEFYAHADAETQRLMEDSALVIVDFNRAIELGYVRLSSRLSDILAETLDDE